nr:amylo-alpha-1,6-glucosidase [Actinomycetota bacterium]
MLPGDDRLVVKNGALFMCSGRDGDVKRDPETGGGVYAFDTRFLSELRLTVGGASPIPLSASTQQAFEAVIDASIPTTSAQGERAIPQMDLSLRRRRLVSDRVYERIEITNIGSEATTTVLRVALSADFADIFEVRGTQGRSLRDRKPALERFEDGVSFGCTGLDDVLRQTIVTFDPPPADLGIEGSRAIASWPIHLDPRRCMIVDLALECSLGSNRPPPVPFDEAESTSRADAAGWMEASTSIETGNHTFDRLIAATMRDLYALQTPMNGGHITAAGIPWYVAPFGRDALWTSYESLIARPSLARDTLLLLAEYQAHQDDARRDAEPGKILHELRTGELAGAGLVPHTPYFGTIDATPLFLILAAAYYGWTGDVETMARLKPHLEAALVWIDDHGDVDGDGFVEYERRSPGGLRNQGWKDSHDAIVNADGSPALGSIALCEVQGYVFMGKLGIAEVFDRLGEHDRARTLRKEAELLRDAFNDAFWLEDEGTYALALDGDKDLVGSVTSNAGHCLFAGIANDDKAQSVADRLMAPDMFSGWGIRTLSSASVAYDPASYHNGSVWPHDNAIIAAGLKRYGRTEDVERIASALFEASMQSPESRLPELFCGFPRHQEDPYVVYPVACIPQAWSSAAPLMLLQTMLGVSADAPRGSLDAVRPSLPAWLERVTLSNLRIGADRMSLAFERHGDATALSALEGTQNIHISARDG